MGAFHQTGAYSGDGSGPNRVIPTGLSGDLKTLIIFSHSRGVPGAVEAVGFKNLNMAPTDRYLLMTGSGLLPTGFDAQALGIELLGPNFSLSNPAGAFVNWNVGGADYTWEGWSA